MDGPARARSSGFNTSNVKVQGRKNAGFEVYIF